jgi:7,8-dihydro-6-hydroxymethylpterin dimethyltransferase
VSRLVERLLSETTSVCPECLSRNPAQRVARGEDVYLCKTCPSHGEFRTVIWRGQPDFESWSRPKLPSHPETPFTAVDRGCPYDCGLCPEHRQQSCCVLLEVTARCDLGCPVCFASANGAAVPGSDPDLSVVESWYRQLLAAGGPFNIQLSGGEPCLRDDLPQIIALGRSLGFTFFQLNTNGLRLARDTAYLQRLAEAGLSTVFLQFDGTTDAIHVRLRGRALAGLKMTAIENCIRQGVGVVLVPTLVPDVNVDSIGAIIRFALQLAPAIRGVHFQPISYFGRYPMPPEDADRITIPEVIRAIETQTGGALRKENFRPPGGENALCSFHGNFVIMQDGSLAPLTSHASSKDCCGSPQLAKDGAAKSRAFVSVQWAAPPLPVPQSGRATAIPTKQSLGEWDTFLERARTHTFCVSGMAFQDAWTLDLDRLRECYIHVAAGPGADCRLVPFCAYNLTDRLGRALYRAPHASEHRSEVRDR